MDFDYIKNEIIGYQSFTKDISSNSLTSSSELGDTPKFSAPMKNMIISKYKLNESILDNKSGAFKFNTTNFISSVKESLPVDTNLKLSSKQKDYLAHWKTVSTFNALNPNRKHQLNYIVNKTSFSADPLFYAQWNLNSIQLPTALPLLTSEPNNVAVAVIDSGSPSKDSSAWNSSNFIDGGYDFVSSTSNGDGDGFDNDPTDPDAANTSLLSHGTHVATTIGAKNDGSNINGFGIKVLPLRVFPVDATGQGGSSYDIQQAILYASGLSNDSGLTAPTETPVKVINLSLGSSFRILRYF